VTSETGRPIDKGALYKLLNNRVYVGEAVHKGNGLSGEHKPIISRELWDRFIQSFSRAHALAPPILERARQPAEGAHLWFRRSRNDAESCPQRWTALSLLRRGRIAERRRVPDVVRRYRLPK
jgi:hypothetical protein